jgi:hypothetical protein
MQQFYTTSKAYRGFNKQTRSPEKVVGFPTFMYQEGTGDWAALKITEGLASEMQKDYHVAIRSGWQIGMSKIMQRAAAQEELQVFGKFLIDPTVPPGAKDPRIIDLKSLVQESMQKMGFDYSKVAPKDKWTPPEPPPADDGVKMNLNVRGSLAEMPPEVQEKAMEKVLGVPLALQDSSQQQPGQPAAPGAMPMSVPNLPQHATSQAPNFAPTSGAPNPGAQI